MGENVIIVGSQNANQSDRFLDRSSIRSVQHFNKNEEFEEVPFFSNQGDLGISSICWENEKPLIWYYTEGTKIIRLNLENKQSKTFTIPKLKGVHEISIIDKTLWISNTYFDEVLAFDLVKEKVIERLKLKSSSNIVNKLDESKINPNDNTRENKFHCNQIFSSYSGDEVALVHHVNGEQLINRVAQKLIKSQGNGGVLFLRSGKTIRLKLKAPHSVRKVNGQYWIFDSGHAQLNIYSKEWVLIKEISMGGWGRGGDFSDKSQLFYAGVSAKRNRYLAFNEENKGENMLQVFSYNFNLEKEVIVPHVEQINNVYLLSDKQLELIKEL